MDIQFNQEDMTLDDLEVFEDIAGIPFSQMIDNPYPPAKALTAIAFIGARRLHPDITLDEVRKSKLINITQLRAADPLDKPKQKKKPTT